MRQVALMAVNLLHITIQAVSLSGKPFCPEVFSFTGSTSSCTSSSMDVIILDSSWYSISKNATRGGNSATGSVTIGEKVGGVTVTKIPVNLTLSCDANGNLN